MDKRWYKNFWQVKRMQFSCLVWPEMFTVSGKSFYWVTGPWVMQLTNKYSSTQWLRSSANSKKGCRTHRGRAAGKCSHSYTVNWRQTLPVRKPPATHGSSHLAQNTRAGLLQGPSHHALSTNPWPQGLRARLWGDCWTPPGHLSRKRPPKWPEAPRPGRSILHAVENMCVTLWSAYISTVPHLQFQPNVGCVCIHWKIRMYSLKYVFIEKYPRISGTTHFKPVMFNSQLY